MYVCVLLFRGRGQPDFQRVRDGNIQCAAQVAPIERTELQLASAAEFIGGLGADNIDDTADRVTAEQRALRPTQYFHAIDVEYVQHAANGSRHVHAVDVGSDTGLRGQRKVGLTDATDKDTRGIRRAADRRSEIESDIRREICHMLHVGSSELVNGRRGICGDGNRSVLETPFPSLRRDRYFLEWARRFDCPARLGWRRGQRSILSNTSLA